MELKMEVYSPNLELLGILSVFRSVMWEELAFSAGSFSIVSIMSGDSVDLLKPENIIWISGDIAGIIEHVTAVVNEDGPILTAKGRLLSGILDRRILWGRYSFFDEPPAIMFSIVDDCAIHPTRGDVAGRVIENLFLDGNPPLMPSPYAPLVGYAQVGKAVLGASGYEKIRKQKTGGSLLTFLEEIGTTHTISFGVRFDPETYKMFFWARPGVNRTIQQSGTAPVFFSNEMDDILSSEYYYESSMYKNIALVAGEGEGDERITQTVIPNGAASFFGLSRRESYVDARDLQKETPGEDEPLTDEEYRELLKDRGGKKLSESQLVQSFESEIRTHGATYQYGVDFKLGDTITVSDDRLGLSVSAVVQAARFTVSETGENMSLTLGYSQPTLLEVLRRKEGV